MKNSLHFMKVNSTSVFTAWRPHEGKRIT